MASTDRPAGSPASAPLRIAHVVPHIGSAQGGPVLALARLTAQQVACGHVVSVVATPLEQDGPTVDLAEGVELITEPATKAFGFRRCPALEPRLSELAARCDVLHSHLLWTDCHRQSARVVRTAGIPHVISPCGTLDDQALRHRGFKKWPAALWFQNRALREAACVNAKSQQEVQAIRDHGLRNPVAQISNPIDYPGPPPAAEVDDFCRRHDLRPDRSRVLFLGRLDPIKGLDRLVRAWARIEEFHTGWELVIAGPDGAGYRKRIEGLVRSSGLEQSVRFTGMLYTEDKWRAIAASELLVLPSDFENFGVVAAEAMSAGRPVITSSGTPWRHVVEARAGWWVEKTPQAIADALREAIRLPAEERRAMGARAVALTRDFTKLAIADAWDSVYRWLLRQGDKPDCILDG